MHAQAGVITAVKHDSSDANSQVLDLHLCFMKMWLQVRGGGGGGECMGAEVAGREGGTGARTAPLLHGRGQDGVRT